MPTEQTFTAYTPAQGANYNAQRPDYPPLLFTHILNHHNSTGGQLGTILDVGCGPGHALRGLAASFTNAIGIDPSAGMIATARSVAAESDDTSRIRFEVSTAEDLGTELTVDPVKEGSVDLITAATAAHWFDMNAFWPRAAQVLKPGGTVAIWASARPFINPDKTPNGAAIQELLDSALGLTGEELRPHRTEGNDLTRDFYEKLPLPWTINTPVDEFDKETFFRKEWNGKGAKPEDNEKLEDGRSITPAHLEGIIGTGSPITRWREANPDKVGTEEDIARRLRRKVEALLHEAGVEPGKEVLHGERSMVLLMIKKKA